MNSTLHSSNIRGSAHTTVRYPVSYLGWIATVTLAFAAMTADAEAPDNLPRKTVSYEDLDLTQAADTRVLYQRLRMASAQVCQPLEGKDLQRQLQYRRCYRNALEGAVASVDNAQLTAFHQSTSGVRMAQRTSIDHPRS